MNEIERLRARVAELEEELAVSQGHDMASIREVGLAVTERDDAERRRDAALARVAELEAALAGERECTDYQIGQVNRWVAECKAALARAERAEKALRDAALV